MLPPDLLTAAQRKGSDTAYRAWLQCRRSCIDGSYSEYLDNGEGRNIAAHVRRSNEAGTGYKPPYSAVPLTNEQHRIQSNKGEAACLERHLGGKWTVEQAKDWFNEKRIEYLKRWIGGLE